MIRRRRGALAALLPAALLGPAALVLLPGPSAASDALQSRWSQSAHTLHAAALPAQVTAALTGVSTRATATYALALPSGVVTSTVTPTAEQDKGSWTSSATFEVPSGTPCGTYALTVAMAIRASRSSPPTAGGAVAVVGCPPELEVAPLDEVATSPSLPWSFRGRSLPGHALGGRLLVDGRQVGPDLTATSFWSTAELDLPCGSSDVQVVSAKGEPLVTRTARLRCPSAVLGQDPVDRTALPHDVPLEVRELASDRPFTVLLDGAEVAGATTDAFGGGRTSVPVLARTTCGPHEVVVRQVLPPVPSLPPYPEPEPAPAPDPGPEADDDAEADDADPPSPTPDPTPTPAPSSPPTAGPLPSSAGGPAVVLRAAQQALPPADRTARVVLPLTVRCPGAASLAVSPPVRADDGRPHVHDLRGEGFGDDLDVEVVAGATPVGPLRADGLGRLSGQVELRLPCGTTTFAARDARGRSATDAVEVRCPSLRVEPGEVSSAELPRGVTALAAGFDSGARLDVLLDDADVGDATADEQGAAVVPLRARGDLPCGPRPVVVRQRGPAPAPQAAATLTVSCPPPATPVVDVSPEVVPDGHVVRVTGDGLPPGPLRLVWRLRDGSQRPATTGPVHTDDGRLRLDLLLLRGEPAGPRQLLALGGSTVIGDADRTLVVLDSAQPGRGPGRVPVLLGRR